jgi:putative aldouronate transport system permease protein
VRSVGWGERLWDVGVIALLLAICTVVVLPLWYVLMISLTPFDVWTRTGGSLFILPTEFSFEAYRQLLSSWRLPRALLVSVSITTVGTLLNLIATVLFAYPLSKKSFKLRNPLLLFVLFTMLFNGGLVPTYLVVQQLGLLDTYGSLIWPGLISGFNLLVMKSFFQSLPGELEDAARIDGASDLTILWRIVLPLSTPILATIGLFYAVAHWNTFFEAILYISDPAKHPLQVVLREILSAGNMNAFVPSDALETAPTEALRMAAVVLTSIPILLVYPFLQRHFTSGVLLGSVKE